MQHLRARVAQSNTALDPAEEIFRAAVVLLAGLYVGQNVDRLARYTGLARAEVSRYVRRLCDNGVWRDSSTHYLWSVDGELGAPFWADVEVARGRMCRRVMEGATEWAPAGQWNKAYDFISPTSASSPSVLYHDRGPEPAPVIVSGGEERIPAERPMPSVEAPSRVGADLFPGATWLD